MDGWELASKSKYFRNLLENSEFPLEYYRADFLQFFIQKWQNLAIGWTAGISPSNRSILRFFLKFLNFLWNLLELIFRIFFTKKRQNLAIVLTVGNSPWKLSISGIFLIFSNWQLVGSLSDDNNLVTFHFWYREIVLKSEKVSKCFVEDCSLDVYSWI